MPEYRFYQTCIFQYKDRTVLFLYINNDQSKTIPVDTEHKLNVHKTFRRRPGRLLNVSFTFNLGPVSTGKMEKFEAHCSVLKSYVMCKISALV